MSPALTNSLRWRWLVPAIVLLGLLHTSPFGSALDRAFYDLASRHPLHEPAIPPGSAMVLIDEHALAAASSQLEGMTWPFPRYVFAGLIAALDRAGAAKIMFDFTFFEASDRADYDLVLASVAAAVPSVVLGRTTTRDPALWTKAMMAEHPELFARPRTGNVDFQADEDGVTRHYRIPGSLAALAVDSPVMQPGGLLHWHGGLSAISLRHEVPVVSATRFLVRGNEIIRRLMQAAPNLTPGEFSRALAAEPRLTGDPAFDAVRGRIVFVGANASGTFDVKPTPVGKIEPGTVLHWTAWTNLMGPGFITELSPIVAWLVAAVTGAVVVFAGVLRPGIAVPTATALGVAMVVFGVAYAGISAGWFLPPAMPFAATTLTLLGVAAESFWLERRRKREIQAMFGIYVDPTVVAQLVRDPNAIRLGGERREATVYFSDLAGFTDLSEKISAAELFSIINLYLQEMSDCLIGHGAYVDKYIGDAVMAVFGAPQPSADHAAVACRAALDARRVLVRINERLKLSHGRTLSMRIGINSGEMMVGNLGSERKRNYTVLGDAVNLASRLEAANKEFGTDILLGENTARAVATDFATRPLTRLRVKGKAEAIEVHELVGLTAELSPDQRAFLASYRDGYARYVAREFAAAAISLDRAAALLPEDRVTAELRRRAQAFARQSPPSDWEPILTLETK